MNKIIIKYIFVFILLFSVFNIFCQSDNTADNVNNNENKTENDKKKFPGIFSFYYKEKIIFENDINQINTAELKSEINLALSFPINIYTIKIWVNDIFITDFEPIINNYRYFYTSDLFFNGFTTGLDNKFKIKKIMNIFANFEFGINTPFNDSLSLYFNPILKLTGNYYFGFNWEIEQSFPIESFLNTGIISLTSSTYSKLAYEFFRFYGPKNFRFTILIEDTFDYLILDYETGLNTLENQLRTGILFKIYNFSPSIYFIYTIYASLSDFEIINNIIGFKTGLYFSRKWFSINADYLGSFDLNNSVLGWRNRIEVYVKFSFNN